MTRQRKDEFVIEVEVQDAATYKLTTEKTGAPLVLEPTTASPASIMRALIEDKRKTGRRKGKRSPIPGLFADATATFSAYAEGNRLVEPESDPAVPTALGRFLQGAAQDIQLTTSSVVGAAPTATSFTESVDDAHEVTAVDGSTTAIGLVGIETASGVEVRPYTYTAATDTLDLLLALPAAPSVGAALYGAQTFQHREQWTALPYPLTVRFLGNDDEQNCKAIGAAPSITVPDTEVDQVAELNVSLRMAYGETGFSDARPSAIDPVPEVTVWAGGQVILAPYGATDNNVICARPTIRLAQNWQRLKCPGGPAAPWGIQDFIRGDAGDGFDLLIPKDLYPSDLGAAAGRWLAILEDESTDEADKEWHCMIQFGCTAGRVFPVYFPRVLLQSCSDAEMDGTDAWLLSFAPHPDAAEPQWVASLT